MDNPREDYFRHHLMATGRVEFVGRAGLDDITDRQVESYHEDKFIVFGHLIGLFLQELSPQFAHSVMTDTKLLLSKTSGLLLLTKGSRERVYIDTPTVTAKKHVRNLSRAEEFKKFGQLVGMQLQQLSEHSRIFVSILLENIIGAALSVLVDESKGPRANLITPVLTGTAAPIQGSSDTQPQNNIYSLFGHLMGLYLTELPVESARDVMANIETLVERARARILLKESQKDAANTSSTASVKMSFTPSSSKGE